MRASDDHNRLQLLTVKQAAERLACSRATLYALIDAGDVLVVQVGVRKGYRIDLRDLDSFIERRKVRFDSCPARVLPRGIAVKHLKL